MTQRLFLFGLSIAIFISGCKNGTDQVAVAGQGTITYRVTYPDSNLYGTKQILFPKTITLVFKGEKAAFISSAGFGMVQLANLLDIKKRTFTLLLIDQLRENVGCKLTTEEIEHNEDMLQFDFEFTSETKEIAGVRCRKAIGTDKRTSSVMEVYYDPKMLFSYFNSPFKDIGHLMFEYSHTINDLTLNLTAIQVDLVTPVDSGLFEVKGNYQWVNQKEFFTYMNTL